MLLLDRHVVQNSLLIGGKCMPFVQRTIVTVVSAKSVSFDRQLLLVLLLFTIFTRVQSRGKKFRLVLILRCQIMLIYMDYWSLAVVMLAI